LLSSPTENPSKIHKIRTGHQQQETQLPVNKQEKSGASRRTRPPRPALVEVEKLPTEVLLAPMQLFWVQSPEELQSGSL
jgi:hypothetical protein